MLVFFYPGYTKQPKFLSFKINLIDDTPEKYSSSAITPITYPAVQNRWHFNTCH
jgi:hypothetical protein